MRKCPYCQKEVKHVKDHIRRMHPVNLDPGTALAVVDQKNENDTTAGAETLELEVPETDTSGYHCVDCGGNLTKGQTPCPKCGAQLNWEAVNG